MLATYEFEVEVFFTETEVKDNGISLRSASTKLETAGVKGVTVEEDVDPIKELKTIPGVDKEKLEDFEAKASKSASEVQSKGAIPPSANATLPPPPQPPSLILDDDDHAPKLSGLFVVLATTLNLLLNL